MKTYKIPFLTVGLLVCSLFISSSVQAAGLAVSPGVTTDTLDKIDMIEDETLREYLKAAVWPGFGERYMNLDRPDEELTPYERNYKEYPLTWEQKIENVKYVLNEADDITKLNTHNVEYIDLEFGEAVIPAADRRVREILSTNYFTKQAEKIEAQRKAALAAYYENGGDGKTLQQIEDQYAAKIAALVEIENKFKEAKVEYLRLQNKLEFERITQEEFNEQTREVVQNFEDFASIGSSNPVFDEAGLKEISSEIYNPSTIETRTTVLIPKTDTVNEKFWYYVLSLAFMIVALIIGYFAFKRLKKHKI